MDPRTAFRQVYQAHSEALYGYFLSKTSDREVAADLVQDLFLRAWRHLPELLSRNDDGQRAWLFTVARNLAIDASRRRGTSTRLAEALRAEPQRTAPSADGPGLSAERLAEVGRAVAALPEDLRTVLTLTAVSEMSSARIGAALGVPAGTVRYRLSKARAAIAANLAAIDADGNAAPAEESTGGSLSSTGSVDRPARDGPARGRPVLPAPNRSATKDRRTSP